MTDPDWNLRKISEERKRERGENIKRYNDESKKQLMDRVHKKMQTAFIGSLAKMEDAFGFLWGMFEDDLDEDEKEIIDVLEKAGFDKSFFRQKWDEARTNILHNGNNQSRSLQQEIEQYSVTWNRHSLRIPVKEKNN